MGFSFGGATEQWTMSADDVSLGRLSEGSSRCVGAIVGADIGSESPHLTAAETRT